MQISNTIKPILLGVLTAFAFTAVFTVGSILLGTHESSEQIPNNLKGSLYLSLGAFLGAGFVAGRSAQTDEIRIGAVLGVILLLLFYFPTVDYVGSGEGAWSDGAVLGALASIPLTTIFGAAWSRAAKRK